MQFALYYKIIHRWLVCCRKDVIAAKKSAQKQGPRQLAEFVQMEETGGPLFCQMIVKYKVECPNRGNGAGRAHFDFIEHGRTVSKAKKLRVGFTGEFLTFDKFIDYKKEQGVEKIAATAEWMELEKDPKIPRDNEGVDKQGNKNQLQIGIVMGNKRFEGWREHAVRDEVRAATKPKKNPNADDWDRMTEESLGNPQSLDDASFAGVLPGSDQAGHGLEALLGNSSQGSGSGPVSFAPAPSTPDRSGSANLAADVTGKKGKKRARPFDIVDESASARKNMRKDVNSKKEEKELEAVEQRMKRQEEAAKQRTKRQRRGEPIICALCGPEDDSGGCMTCVIVRERRQEGVY